MSAQNTYSEMDVLRYINSGDPVTFNGCVRYWGACSDSHITLSPTPGYKDLKSFRWRDIKSFESLEKTKQEIANEFSEFFNRGWRLVKASYHDKLHTIPYPLLLERRIRPTHACFYVGKVSKNTYPRQIELIRDDDTKALKIAIANPRILKKIQTDYFPYYTLSYVFFFLRNNTPAPDFVDLEATRYQAFVHAIAPDYVLELPNLTPALSVEPLAELYCMTGFERSEWGTGDCVWASPCHVLADRDLQQDESVHVWAVDPIDGRVLKTVSLKATDANKARVAWPAAVVKATQDDRTLVEGSVLLQAGHLSDDAEFTENTDAPTSQTFTGYNNIEKSQVDRLWAFDSHCKLLSNLPFKEEGRERITAATHYAQAPVGSDLEQIPSTRWEWSHSADGATQLARLIEKVSGEQQLITRHLYQTDNAVPEPLRQPRQTEQHITIEDLRVAATAEEQQP